MLLVKMALRNLARNLRRTLITAIAIAFGLAMLIVSSGVGDGGHGEMIAQGVRDQAGHVVVQGQGWQQKRDSEITVPDSRALLARLRAAVPEAQVVPRVYLQGLLTSPDGSAGVQVSAVDPRLEAEVSDVAAKIIEGAYLDADPSGVVLGQTLAESLGVGVGDKVVLMAQRQGEIESRLFRVRGLFRFGIDEIDGFYAQIPISPAQRMLGLGEEVTQLSLILDSARDTGETAARVRRALAGAQVEVLTWQQAMPDLYEWIRMDDAGIYVFILIIAVIVALGIVNTVLMSVLERMRELGVMLAVGMTPRQVAVLVLVEATLLGLFAVGAGVALGLAGNWPLAVYGVDLSAIYGGQIEAAGVALSAHIYSDLAAEKVALFAALALGMTVLAALYPAYKAARLQPIQCLQHR